MRNILFMKFKNIFDIYNGQKIVYYIMEKQFLCLLKLILYIRVLFNLFSCVEFKIIFKRVCCVDYNRVKDVI